MYGHKAVDFVLQLDACLTGLPSGFWGNMVYHLPIPCGFKSLDIVHLEMANILVVVKIFARTWTGRRVLIKCNNQAVVALFIYLFWALRRFQHFQHANNIAADLLSRGVYSLHNIQKLQALV